MFEDWKFVPSYVKAKARIDANIAADETSSELDYFILFSSMPPNKERAFRKRLFDVLWNNSEENIERFLAIYETECMTRWHPELEVSFRDMLNNVIEETEDELDEMDERGTY